MSQIAIIYARFSTLEQGKGSSLERQLGNGRKYVAEAGFQLGAELTDLGRSAFHGANRAEGAELHDFEIEAREGKHHGKVLCAENLDRLSRQGVKAAAKLIWALNDCGVDVATWHDRHVYKAKADNDLTDIIYIATNAQRSWEESDTKSRRGKDAWGSRYKNIADKKPGTRSGRPPQWLVWNGQHYDPDPRRSAVLNEIFDCYIEGMGTYRIVQMLNAREEPAWPISKNSNGGWYLAYVHSLLRNRAALGEYVTLKGEVIATDYYPRVVSMEKFTQVQAILNGRAKVGGRDFQRFNNLLSGLPRCAACDGTGAYENKGENSTTAHVRKDGSRVHYQRKHYERLRCDNNRRRKGCGNATLFDYKVVEKAVLDKLLDLTTDDERRTSPTQALDEQIAIVSREMEVTQKRLINIVDALADGGSRALTKRIGELEEEADKLETQRKLLVSRREAEASKPNAVDDAHLIARVRLDLASEDQALRLATRSRVNSALRRIVDGIFLAEDGTFTVLSEVAVWHFDGNGQVIGGQML